MNKDLRVCVVYGGFSTEREVSLKSGSAIFQALRSCGFKNATLFDLDKNNISKLLESRPDIAFLALHGKGGEDGSIQGALELAGIPYTGPGAAASAVCMNKITTKQVLSSIGIPTPRFLSFHKFECGDRNGLAKRLVEELGLPLVLKSPCQGSSIGVVLVKSADELLEGFDEIFKYGDQLLAEEFIEGIEVTLPILGNDSLLILPEIEITSERAFYDYVAKYTNGLCHHIIPARISDTDRDSLRTIGELTYRKMNCCGLSRIDFIIDKKRGPMVIEINTLPGMTGMSLVPDAAKAVGISFEDLVTRILEFGWQMKRE